MVLFSAGIIYILAGLFFRDPWKTDDVVGLATMLSAINSTGTSAWFFPQITGLEFAEQGPLITWVGALCILLFAPLLEIFTSSTDALIIASRLPNLLWFGILCTSVWYGTYLLGRRPEPQPLSLPFGGEPSVRDYGRMIADAALLLLVATVGTLWHLHETSVVPAMLAAQALAFYAIARMLDRPVSGALTLGAAIGMAFLTRGWIGATPLLIATLLCFSPHTVLWHKKRSLLFGLLAALIIGLIWWLFAQDAGSYRIQQWLFWQKNLIAPPSITNSLSSLRDLAWFIWPAWPFAILAIWQWRKWVFAPHIWVPLIFAVVALTNTLFIQNASEPEYSLLAIPCAILAAFSLPTLRRGLVNALDWFAIMCFSLAITTVWLGWFALQTGWPPKIEHNITRLIAGYNIYISWLAVAIAMAGTLAWFILVRWRLIHKPLALWRGTVLSAGGLIATWVLLATLWMPVLDYARSYRHVSAELATTIAQQNINNSCIRNLNVGKGQLASFYVFNNIELTYDTNCPLILQQTNLEHLESGQTFNIENTTVIWQGKRRPDRHEIFQLLKVNNN